MLICRKLYIPKYLLANKLYQRKILHVNHQTTLYYYSSKYQYILMHKDFVEKGTVCYAHVNSLPLLVRGCVTNRKNLSLNSNTHEKYPRSGASVAATQVLRTREQLTIISKRLRHRQEERMSELQCSRDIFTLRGICSYYSGYQKSSRSMKVITDWNNMEDNSDLYPVHICLSMHNTLKDGHPN